MDVAPVAGMVGVTRAVPATEGGTSMECNDVGGSGAALIATMVERVAYRREGSAKAMDEEDSHRVDSRLVDPT